MLTLKANFNMLKKINFDEEKGIDLKTKVLIGIFLFFFILYWVNKFFDNYRLTSPIDIKIRIKSPIEKRIQPQKPNRSQNKTNKIKKTSVYTQKEKTSQEGAKFGQILASTKIVEEKVIPFPKLLNEREYELRKEILEYVKDKLTENQIIAFDNIIKKESGYNPASKNDIGAGGLCQAYPYEKMNCELKFEDWKCQVDWCLKYIENRYKNPIEAWRFHLVNNWF
jgi:hypothetical protein